MEYLSQIAERVRLPVDVTVLPHLLDHRFEGNAVFPAVEAMQVLAETIKRFRPDSDIARMFDVRFDKFIYIQPGTPRIPVLIDVSVHQNGDLSAVLLTKEKAKKTSMMRIKEHASIRFSPNEPKVQEPPLDLTSSLEGVCFEIPCEAVYRELVPFGPAYHNIRDLYISEEGAIARTGAPPIHAGAEVPDRLGSPFPLDAAFHAACVWGQRYSGIVAFPVGIERRILFNRTKPDTAYVSRIIPTRITRDLLTFDIWIYDDNGALFEGVCGVHMRDVSGGRMKPPPWVVGTGEKDAPARLQRHCRALSLIELKTVTPYAEKTLSDYEKKRFYKMAGKRRRSYLAARLACKRLSRTLSGGDSRTPAVHITTVCDDSIHPCCPPTDGSRPVFCSVSHDDRFAIAVASDSPVGVDVERVSERALKSLQVYMNESERTLVQESPLGQTQAAVRIWSIKEAVAKAIDIPLADSWNRVRVGAVDHDESRFQVDGKTSCTAVHDVIGEHVVTLACRF